MANTKKRTVERMLAGALLLAVLLGSRIARANDPAPSDRPEQGQSAGTHRYQLAIGGGLAAGGQGFDAERIGAMAELGVRWQWLPVLGLGGTLSSLAAGYEFHAGVIGVHASVHPFTGLLNAHLDPYVRFGPVYFAQVGGKLQYNPDAKTSRLGAEGVLGFDFAWRYFAFGPDLRWGWTNQPWNMLGLHLEGRL